MSRHYSLIAVFFLFSLAFFDVEVWGLPQSNSRELTIADIPPCGLRCLFIVLPPSGCAPTDIECICASDSLEHELAACLLANCTMQDALDTSRVQADLCNLSEESRTQEVILYTAIVYSIAFICVVLRVAGKAVSQRLSWDDAVVVAAFLLTTIPLACVLDMSLKGFGGHMWNLEDGKLLPILRYLYIAWSTYVIVLCMIKISLVLFYLEIFKTPRFRKIAYTFLAYLVTNSLAIFLVAIFPCTPVSSFWNRDIKGRCVDIRAVAYANSASAIVQDIGLIIMPLAFIRNLQMKRYRKIAVGFMFVIGTFGCVATIMRLPSLSTFQISIDPSWDYVPVTIWTELELGAGILCVSLPSIRILLVKILPKQVLEFLSSITHPSRNKSGNKPQQRNSSRQRKANKPPACIDISVNSGSASDESTGKSLEPLTLGSGVRGSFMSAFWKRTSTQPSHFSYLRSGSRRLESAMSNYSESAVAVTRPPYHEERNNSTAEQVEMFNVPSREHHDYPMTALPQIGCTIDGIRSESDTSMYPTSPAARWSHFEKHMV